MKVLKIILLISFVLVGLLFLSISNAAENKVILYEFYGEGCPHCASLNVFLDDLEEKYPNLEVKRYCI